LATPYYFAGMNAKELHHPMVRLEDVCEIHMCTAPPNVLDDKKGRIIPYVNRTAGLSHYVYNPDEYLSIRHFNKDPVIYPKGTVLFGHISRKVAILKIKAAVGPAFLAIVPNEDVLPEFLYRVLKTFVGDLPGVALNKRGFSIPSFRKMLIALPPLAIQKKVVRKLEHIESIIEQARVGKQNSKPVIEVDPLWEMVEIGDIFERIDGPNDLVSVNDGVGYKMVERSAMASGRIVDDGSLKLVSLSERRYDVFRLVRGDILFIASMARYDKIGAAAIFDLPGSYVYSPILWRLRVNKQKANAVYTNMFMNTTKFKRDLTPIIIEHSFSRDAGLWGITKNAFVNHKIPLPPIDVQKQLSADFEKWQTTATSYQKIIDTNEIKMRKEMTGLFRDSPDYALGFDLL
jgi:restriction endonuclease S subunit